MKKWILLLSTCAVTLIAGCQGIMGNEAPTQEQQTIQHHHTQQQINREDVDRTKFGFVRYTGAQIRKNNASPNVAYYDRSLLADSITKMTVYLPGVHEAASLVTDKYALIVYQTDTQDRERMATQVRRTAEAVLPRFYDVYVSDNFEMFDDIERFGALSSQSPDVEQIMSQTINEMQQSPQGFEQAEQLHDQPTM